MAQPSDDSYQPVSPSPDLASARLAAINRQFAPDEPPAPEHPAVTFAKNILNPLNYQPGGLAGPSQLPTPAYGQGPLIRSLAQPPQTNDILSQLTTQNPMFNFTSPEGTTPPLGQDAANFVGNIPVLGGLGNLAARQLQQGPLSTYLLGSNPEYNRIQAMPEGLEKKQALSDFQMNQMQNAALGAVGGIENVGAKAARGVLGAVGADQSAIAAKLAAAEKAPLTKLPEQAAADAAGVKSTVDVSTAEGQRASLLKAGFTPQQVDEFAKTMAPPPEVKPAIQTAEGQAVDPALLTRSLQTAAGTEGVPLSQNPIFEKYGIKGMAGPRDLTKHGGDIGTATRAVMSGDPEASALLGPDLTQQLIQNKIAQIVRDTGAPEDVIRRGLSVIGPSTDAALSSSTEIASVGKNVDTVLDAVTDALPPPRPPMGPNDKIPGGPGGGMPPDQPLPEIPANPKDAGKIAREALGEILGLGRSVMVAGHLPMLRQGMTQIVSHPIALGAPAVEQMVRAIASSPLKAAAMDQALRDTAMEAGFRIGRDDLRLNMANGPLSAREEYMVGKLPTLLPIVGPIIKRLNQGFGAMLNSLRVGSALMLKENLERAGLPTAGRMDQIQHFANIVTGSGDLPGANTEVSKEVAQAMSQVFFGPRLMTSSWQSAVDTIKSLGAAARSLPTGAPQFLRGEGTISKVALSPIDAERIRATTAFVAANVGLMKLAQAAGMDIGTDPTKTDFGRITLPGGARVDLWGPFNEEARLVARELVFASTVYQGQKPPFGGKNGVDLLLDYGRSRLNWLPGIGADIATGTTQGGVPTRTALTTLDPNINPAIPVPFNVHSALNAFGPNGPGGLEAAGQTALTALGATVIDQPAQVTYDGVGKPNTDPQFGQDPVLAESLRFTKTDPSRKDVLGPPNTVLGSGKNAIKLDKAIAPTYVQMVGEQRRVDVSSLLYSPEYQNATLAQQEKMFDAAVSKADNTADRKFLAQGVINSTDPAVITAEAVAGFHAQQGSQKNEAYWIALLDRAGKLTPSVAQAIDDSNVVTPGKKAPITVDEYRKAAPLVHEYLAHVPYGTDTHPIGAPADWTAVAQAHVAKNNRVDEMVRSGVAPSLADTRAQAEILKSLTVLVQRNLFLNGTQLENPARTKLAIKYPTLNKFLGTNHQYLQESEAQYQNFPNP